ncbi:hypothetical protein Slin14017_G021300 [Septoria linicola]|nr:hypothetical protein Slin14017_G021300 [Septoria linicola]
MYDQNTNGSEPDTIDYLRREGFPTRPVEVRDAEEGHELQGSTLPEPSRKRRRGWSPGCAVLFRGLSSGRLCSEDPESDEADSDDDLVSCSSEAGSEDAHAMSQSSSPAKAGDHSSPPSPATTLLSDDHGSTVVESIERAEWPETPIDARQMSITLESELSQVAGPAFGHSQPVADEDDDQPQSRRSPTPPDRWRCRYQGEAQSGPWLSLRPRRMWQKLPAEERTRQTYEICP